MRRADAVARLLKLEGPLKGRGIEHVYLFGSVARDVATEDSDVDIAFDVRDGVPFDAFDRSTGREHRPRRASINLRQLRAGSWPGTDQGVLTSLAMRCVELVVHRALESNEPGTA